MREQAATAGKGHLVARTLARSWRGCPAQPEISETELDQVTPLLYGSGAAALGWWRIRESNLKKTSAGHLLHQAYRLQALQSAIHEQKIQKVFRLMREASVEVLMAKGWAAAGLYPNSALRPYGDIDLLVRPDHFERAQLVLRSPDASDCWVDLHEGFYELADRTVEELFLRADLRALGSEQIRILGYEDHLALLAVHFLRHGAWRPLWLCDISAAVESLPAEFDWDLCLGRNRKRAGWITCAIALCERLLAANTARLPWATKVNQIPGWLLSNVLRQWEEPFPIQQAPKSHPMPMASYLKHPGGVFAALRKRWPNPILATISVNGEFSSRPRLPYQLGNCLLRAGRFLINVGMKGEQLHH